MRVTAAYGARLSLEPDDFGIGEAPRGELHTEAVRRGATFR
jgi:hypothetical protein